MKPSQIVDEPSFKRLLWLERRRCERTGANFLLVLLDANENALEKLAMPLGKAFRDTDVAGWYQPSSKLGVIFTTLNGTPRDSIKSAISARVAEMLDRHLRSEQKERVELSFYFFPEEDTDVSQNQSRKVLYPDTDNDRPSHKLFVALKRIIDIVGSLIALIVLSPLFLLISAGIRLTSTGPVLFRQKRMGKNGVEFTFLKFRSMYIANDPQIHRQYIKNLIGGDTNNTSGIYKIQNDPRVTPFGRLLRVTSLDELPQFINVLTGKMSLVGPRPPIRYEFDCYKLWHRRRVLEVKPGITGVWQVHGRSRTTFDEMVRMDLRYVRERSLWYDLKILLKTPLAVISREGAF